MATKKTKVSKQTSDGRKITCLGTCGRELTLSKANFYMSNNPEFLKYDGFSPICKSCSRSMIYKSDNTVDIEAFKRVLQYLNKPFIRSVFEELLPNGITLGDYTSRLNFGEYKHWTYKDSDFGDKEEKNKTNNDSVVGIKIESDFEITPDILSFWGKGYTAEQYESLQNFFDDFITGYECDSPAQVLNFKNAAKTQLQADEALISNNVDMYNKLMKTLSTILGDSNVKPVQSTGANAAEQSTFGILIKKYENERPIPKPDSDWEDVDGIKKYIDTWYFGHLCKMLNIKNDYSQMYEEEMKKFRVEVPEYEDGEE